MRALGPGSVAALTVASMLAFAGNSLLCREALASGAIDPAGFTTVRLAAAALMLLTLGSVRRQRAARSGPLAGSWLAAGALFGYAVCFSFAYVAQPAGTGALLLFGAVQTTMILVALARGERLGALHWLGLVVAVAGIVVLVAPGVGMPSPWSALTMIVSGVCWACYTLLGRSGADPLAVTTGNFVRTLPITAPLSLSALALGSSGMAFVGGGAAPSARGIGLAALSGAVTSGLGYTLWYAALPALTVTRAATVQLSVPLLAALGGVLLLGEAVTTRLVLASILILGGIALTLTRLRVERAQAPSTRSKRK